MPFRFVISDTPDEQIAALFAHLAEIDAEFAQLLRASVNRLTPLPSQGPQRNTARQLSNAEVERALDELAGRGDTGA